MLKLRYSEDRGRGHHGWLDSRHTFSFAQYYDPRFVGFHDLLVINEDRVAPGSGFPTHRHADMEIISYVLEGAIEHKDSTGVGATLRPGEVQRMSAGTGVAHSEFNPSPTQKLHFLQIWIRPAKFGLPPSYEQTAYSVAERKNRLRLVGSQDARDGSVVIHQDVDLFATLIDAGRTIEHPFRPGRVGWLQVAHGRLTLNGIALSAGDGVAIEDEGAVSLECQEDAELLLFDLKRAAK
jgi:redox-sensitive bicupin YhaK (pirin superfamily)